MDTQKRSDKANLKSIPDAVDKYVSLLPLPDFKTEKGGKIALSLITDIKSAIYEAENQLAGKERKQNDRLYKNTGHG